MVLGRLLLLLLAVLVVPARAGREHHCGCRTSRHGRGTLGSSVVAAGFFRLCVFERTVLPYVPLLAE